MRIKTKAYAMAKGKHTNPVFSVAVCVSPGKEDECGIVDPSSYVVFPTPTTPHPRPKPMTTTARSKRGERNDPFQFIRSECQAKSSLNLCTHELNPVQDDGRVRGRGSV